MVRHRPLGRRARRDLDGQGSDECLRAARRGRHAPPHRRALSEEFLLRWPDLQQSPAGLRRGDRYDLRLRRRQTHRERAENGRVDARSAQRFSRATSVGGRDAQHRFVWNR